MTLSELRYVVPMGHKWAKRKSIRPDELAAENPILLNFGHCFRDQLLHACPGPNRAEAIAAVSFFAYPAAIVHLTC